MDGWSTIRRKRCSPSHGFLPLVDALRLVPLRLGQRDEMGFLVVGSRRLGFPTPTEKLILNMAANQAVMTCKKFCRLSEKERVA